ncbi:MAG: winged helix-turn-helix transcriptional regulator [Clostridia bacterium]|nr:winged helix-turn-helix transcriptional regulator [Clostridia bacterium]
MQIHIETADRQTDALLQTALPFLEAGLILLSRGGSVIFTDDETCPHLARRDEGAVLFVFYRHERWLADPLHKQLSEAFLYAALPWPVSIPALEETILRLCRLDSGKTRETSAEPFRFSPEEKLVHCGGGSVRLTDKEYRILTLLYSNRGQAVDKSALVASVWPEGIHGNVCEVNVTHLRQKLAPLLGNGVIGSIRGKGYILRLP